MKNILFTLLLTVVFYFAHAQSKFDFAVSLPVNSHKIGTDSLKRYEEAKFKTHSLIADSNRHYFISDNIIVGFWDFDVDKKDQKALNQRLIELQKSHPLANDSSVKFLVKKYDTVSSNYIIEKYQKKGIYYMRFYSDYMNGQILCGILMCNPSERRNAESILLTSLKYSFRDDGPSHKFKVTLPENARHLDSDSIKLAIAQKYKMRTYDIQSRYYYNIEGITLGYWENLTNKYFQNPLIERMHWLKYPDEVQGYYQADISIKSYNHIDYIIEKYQEDGLNYIRFFSDYYDRWSIGGILSFNPSDKEKAMRIFDAFINGVYKNN